MTKEQAHKIYDLAVANNISKVSVFIMLEEDIVRLTKSNDEIHVIIDCKYSENLEQYNLDAIKLISHVIPCKHLNSLKKDKYAIN